MPRKTIEELETEILLGFIAIGLAIVIIAANVIVAIPWMIWIVER